MVHNHYCCFLHIYSQITKSKNSWNNCPRITGIRSLLILYYSEQVWTLRLHIEQRGSILIVLSNFEHYGSILTNVDQYCIILSSFEHGRSILTLMDQHCIVLNNFEHYRSILTSVDQYCISLSNFEHYGSILTNVNIALFWAILTITGQYWPT